MASNLITAYLLASCALPLVFTAPQAGGSSGNAGGGINLQDVSGTAESGSSGSSNSNSGTTPSVIQADITNYNSQDGFYLVNISIGTPPRNALVTLDTGSSDFWVVSTSTDFCQQNPGQCPPINGNYDQADSSSAHQNPAFGPITDNYGIGSATFDIYTETVSIGDPAFTLQNLTVGVASHADNPIGILGVGPPAPGQPLGLVPSMKKANTIQSNMFGVFLNKPHAPQGSVVFGGVDTSKYTGTFQTVPLSQEDGQLKHYISQASSVSISGLPDGSYPNVGNPLVGFDMGSSISHAPQAMVAPIYAQYGINVTNFNGVPVPVIDCKANLSNIQLVLEMGVGGEIRVQLEDLIDVGPQPGVCAFGLVDDEQGPPPGTANDTNTFVASSNSNIPLILGANVLRSYYTVFDLENNQIGIAKASFGNAESNLAPILPASPYPTGTGD